jgi:hypothetical protein
MPMSSMNPVNVAQAEQPGYSAPGAVPGVARKMIERANAGLGEANAIVAAAKRLTRTVPETGLEGVDRSRRVHSVQDVTRGLGLDGATEQKLQRLIEDTPADFDSRSHQRISQALAQLMDVTRKMKHVPADVRTELQTRARAYYQNTRVTDYGAKSPSIRYQGTSMAKASPRLVLRKAVAHTMPGVERPPRGFIMIPKSKKGGYKSPDGKQYWYPDGKGVRGAAQAEEGGEQHAGPPTAPPKGKTMAPQGASSFGPTKPEADARAKNKTVVDSNGTERRLGDLKPTKGPKKPAAGGDGAGHRMQFTPAPEGASPFEQELHHRGEHAKAKAAFRAARAAGDQEGMKAAAEAGKQHAEHANQLIRQNAQAYAEGQDPKKGPQGAPGASQGSGADEGSDEDEGGLQEGAGGQEAGSDSYGDGGEDDDGLGGLVTDPQEGLSRTSSGMQTSSSGGRQTAARDRKRTIPEAPTVRAVREKLGRALNVMADLSAAHDDLADLQRKRAAAKASNSPMRKQLLAGLDAEIAATKHDIAQLEDAHAAAMQEVNAAQNEMRMQKIKESPIFQAFMQLMNKMGTLAGGVADATGKHIENAKDKMGIGPKKEALPQLQNTNEPFNVYRATGMKDPGKKTQFKLEEQDPRYVQAKQVLSRLGAGDEEEGQTEEPKLRGAKDDEQLAGGADDSAQGLLSDILSQRSAQNDDEAQPANDAGEPDAHAQTAPANDAHRDAVSTVASAGPKSRKQQLREKFKAADDEARRLNPQRSSKPNPQQGDIPDEWQKFNVKVKPRYAGTPISDSAIREREEARTVAPKKKLAKSIPMGMLVKSDAWRLAMELGMEASAQLREHESDLPAPKFVLRKSHSRQAVPYFFNEL